MKKLLLLLVVLLAILEGIFIFEKIKIVKKLQSDYALAKVSPTGKIEHMKITSPVFADNGTIPDHYTCKDKNINPPLLFSDIPVSAKSLALIVDDPDAPMGTWIHWVIFNISPGIKEIAENSTPKDSIEGMTSFGKPGYGGPCPPSGTHHYFFKLYALNTSLPLDHTATKQDVEATMKGHILEQAQLIGLVSK